MYQTSSSHSRIAGHPVIFYWLVRVSDPAKMLNGTRYHNRIFYLLKTRDRPVRITALEHECKNLVSSKSFVTTAVTGIQTSIVYYALQCAATTTQIKLLTLAHSGMYASYTTSCTSSACTAMEPPSQYPVTVPAEHTGEYRVTPGSGQI